MLNNFDVEDAYNLARSNFINGNIGKSLYLLESIFQNENPIDKNLKSRTSILFGQCYLSLEDYEKALKSFAEALNFVTLFTKTGLKEFVTHYIGICLVQIGKFEAAIEPFTKCIEWTKFVRLDLPKPIRTVKMSKVLAGVNFIFKEKEQEKIQKTISYIRRKSFLQRALCYHKNRKVQKALADLSTLVKSGITSFTIFNLRGKVYRHLNRYEESESDYTKAIAMNDTKIGPFLGRGLVYVKMNEKGKALADFSKAIKINPEYGPARINRGNVYQELVQQFPEKRKEYLSLAVEDYSEAISSTSWRNENKNITAYLQRGMVYGKIEEWEKCISDLSIVIDDDAERLSYGISVYFFRAMAHLKLQDAHEALLDFSEAKNRVNEFMNENEVQFWIDRTMGVLKSKIIKVPFNIEW